MSKLTPNDITEHLARLDEWQLNGECIEKEFEFEDFLTAMAFMNLLTPTAESLNHHPDWSNSYNKVHISLTSHEASGLTEKDFSFARAADEIAAQVIESSAAGAAEL